MPGEPFVCCICLTKDRPQYLPRAIASYEAQTYQHKALFVMDASTPEYRNRTIGWLRNQANKSAHGPNMLIAHFDDDDWSAPTRLAEQVAFMQATGAQVVGYHDMPFYDEIRDKVLLYSSHNPNYALGTSLMYRRETWERVPFPDQNDEDTTWQNLLGPQNVHSVSSVEGRVSMFATIHKGNTSPKQGARFQAASPELDSAVRNLLAVHA